MQKLTGPVLLCLAGWYLLAFFVTAMMRINYPYELEFLEGTSGILVGRILDGLPIYQKPTLEYIALNYTPLYYYAGAGVAAVFGRDLFAARLVSLLSALVCMALVALIVRRETKSTSHGIIAAGVYAGSYGFTGAWFDAARNDSTFMALFLGAVYLVRFAPSIPGAAGAGFLLALAFLTKQTAAMLAPWLLLYAVLYDRRQAAVIAGTGVLVAGGVGLWLNSSTNGWFYYFVFTVAGLHGFAMPQFVQFWRSDILPHLAPALLIILLPFSTRPSLLERKSQVFYGLLVIGGFCASWLVRSHQGAYMNVLIPAAASASILFGIALHSTQTSPGTESFRLFFAAVAILQFLVLFYNPGRRIPTKEDRRAGDRFVQQLAQMPGDVWVPSRGYVAQRAGKEAFANAIAIYDVLLDEKQRGPGGLQEEIARALQERRFSAIIFDAEPSGAPVSKPQWIDDFYRFDGRLPVSNDANAFRPITGVKSRPELVFVPK